MDIKDLSKEQKEDLKKQRFGLTSLDIHTLSNKSYLRPEIYVLQREECNDARQLDTKLVVLKMQSSDGSYSLDSITSLSGVKPSREMNDEFEIRGNRTIQKLLYANNRIQGLRVVKLLGKTRLVSTCVGRRLDDIPLE